MRMIALLPLLMVVACSVESDRQNDQVTLDFDEEQVENTAESLGNAAEEAASEVESAAENAGRAIENEVGDIDVDLNIDRNKARDTN